MPVRKQEVKGKTKDSRRTREWGKVGLRKRGDGKDVGGEVSVGGEGVQWGGCADLAESAAWATPYVSHRLETARFRKVNSESHQCSRNPVLSIKEPL